MKKDERQVMMLEYKAYRALCHELEYTLTVFPSHDTEVELSRAECKRDGLWERLNDE